MHAVYGHWSMANGQGSVAILRLPMILPRMDCWFSRTMWLLCVAGMQKLPFVFGALNKMKFSSCTLENLGHCKSKPQRSGVCLLCICVCVFIDTEHEMPLELKESEREGARQCERDSAIVVMKRNERNQSMWHVSGWTCSSRYGRAPADQYVTARKITKLSNLNIIYKIFTK